jgi:hypothetical protein
VKVALAGLVALLFATAAVACAQVAGVQEVTFTGEQDAAAPPPDAHDAARTDGPAGADGADAGGPSLPSEDCPTCGGKTCCSPMHCAQNGTCCADRGESCATAADCCNGMCDVDAGWCTGPCLPSGGSPCVANTDCCEGTCNSEGKCKPCAPSGGNCTSDPECCFGLSCTSSEAGTCEAL